MKLDYETNNGMKFSKIIEPGECMAMTCDWSRVSLMHGKSRKDLLNPAKWHIGQSAYEKGQSRDDEQIIAAMGLSVVDKARDVAIGSGSDVASRLSKLQGTYVWGVVGKGGHAMGYRNTGKTIEFFDPNDGLYICDDADDFKSSVAKELDTYYSKLLGTLDWYKVRL
ncbi:MAG: hypothetical protein AAFU85_08855 [Planctomycetota bacterium]